MHNRKWRMIVRLACITACLHVVLGCGENPSKNEASADRARPEQAAGDSAVATGAKEGAAKEGAEKEGAAKQINWLDSLDAALKAAGQAKKLVMVDFSTEWCGWCKRLDKQTFSDSKVIRQAERFVALRLDGDKHRDLVKKYKVQGYPTVLFLNAAAGEVHRVVGFRDPAGFLVEMTKALDASGATGK